MTSGPCKAITHFVVSRFEYRMIRPIRRDVTERQIIVFNDRRHDIATARGTLLDVVLDRNVSDHGIAFRATASLRVEDTAKRRP